MRGDSPPAVSFSRHGDDASSSSLLMSTSSSTSSSRRARTTIGTCAPSFLLVLSLVVATSSWTSILLASAYLLVPSSVTDFTRRSFRQGRPFVSAPCGAAAAAKSARKTKKAGENAVKQVNTKDRVVADVELAPEPEGGMELTSSLLPAAEEGSTEMRMKELRALDESEISAMANDENSKGPPPTHEFWMKAFVPAEGIANNKATLLKEAGKKANFPGFRKGQVPPYAMPQIIEFAVQDAIISTVKVVLDQFGVANDGNGEVTVHEDVSAIAKNYKAGTDIPFTANIQASYAPKSSSISTEASTVVDVDATAVVESSE